MQEALTRPKWNIINAISVNLQFNFDIMTMFISYAGWVCFEVHQLCFTPLSLYYLPLNSAIVLKRNNEKKTDETLKRTHSLQWNAFEASFNNPDPGKHIGTLFIYAVLILAFGYFYYKIKSP